MEDKKALRQWEKSNISYKNYIDFINAKESKFELTYLDLFFIKNFKGGFATFNEMTSEINKKLVIYSALLIRINNEFGQSKIVDLNDKKLEDLIKIANESFDLLNVQNETKIDGFGYSFLTTLLHFHFPNLFPILDRRVLNGLKLINKSDLDSSGQVKNLMKFYPKLIKAFRSKLGNKTIRELDKELFIIKL